MFAFVANSAWYLRNFRISSLVEFSLYGEVLCLHATKNSYELDDLKVKNRYFFLNATSIAPGKELYSISYLIYRLLRERPRVLFSFNPKTNIYALLACWLLRIPCVPNVSGVGVASQLKGVAGKIYHGLSRFLYRRATYVFFQNSNDYHVFVDSGWVRKDKAEILPGSGVNLKAYKPCIKKSSKVRFLMAARLITPKGVIEYIEAAREVLKQRTDCVFYLAGIKDFSSRAIDEEYLKSLDKDLDINFVGHVKNMPELLEDVDCVVLPSYYPEGTPRFLIEGAAAGKIIVTTDMPGCRDLVDEGANGFLIEPRSSKKLAAAFLAVISLTQDERESFKKVSRKLAESRFDENFVVQRYLVIAQKVAGLSPS